MSPASSSDPRQPRTNRANALAVILLVGGLVTLPFFAQLFGIGAASGENRVLASFPRLKNPTEIKDLPRMLDAYVNDRFGLRSQLVRLNSLIRYKLGVSSTRDVVIGQDGWLFFTANKLMEQHTGADVFSPAELEYWVGTMQTIEECLKRHGIAFYLVLAPDKSTIYPEKLPDYPRPPSATTRFDQVVARMKQTDIEFIDPRAELLKAKAKGVPIYFEGDTHWREQGAFVAYSMLMEKVRQRFPDLKPLTSADFNVGLTQSPVSDLVKLLALEDDLHYQVETWVRKSPSHIVALRDNSMRSGWGWRVVEIDNDLDDKPRLLVFGDSFTEYVLGPYFLYETFRDPMLTFHNGATVNFNLVSEVKPDLVVIQMADRYLQLRPLKSIGFDSFCAGVKSPWQ